MSRIFLPPKVAREHRENSREFAAAIKAATFEDPVCHRWNRELARVDPLLRMVKNRSDDAWVVGTPLVPGAYHLLRVNEGAPMSVTPVVDPSGRPLPEPPGRLLEDLKAMDLQNVQVTELRRKVREESDRREERRKELVREQRRDTIAEHWKAVSETSVSMNRDTPWSQNAAGKRGVKKAD